jgi:hypothetical protein
VAEHTEGLVRRTKKLGAVGFGGLAVTAALLSFGAGTASADEIFSDQTPSSGPAVEDGVRSVQGQLRATDIGVAQAQGVIQSEDGFSPEAEVRGSNIAVPVVFGQSPPPGDLSQLGFDCLFSWSQFCQ